MKQETLIAHRASRREQALADLRDGRRNRGGFHRDKSKYSRKQKHKKGYNA